MLHSHDNFLLNIWQTNCKFPRVIIPLSPWISLFLLQITKDSHFPLPKEAKQCLSVSEYFHCYAAKLLISATTLSLFFFPMATVTSSFHFSTLTQSSQRNFTLSSNSPTFRFRVRFSCHYLGVRASSYASKMVVRCSSSSVTGLFGSPLSEEKRVQLYTSFGHLLVLWELGCFQFLFFFSLMFEVENVF